MRNFNVLSRRSFLDRSLKTSLGVALSTLVDIPFVVKRALGLALVRALQRTLHRIYPHFHLSGALTLEEAIQMLETSSADETVEVPASSLAQVGSQSRSGFPQSDPESPVAHTRP